MTARIITADCRDAMREMDADSIDAIVCDPPYGLSFMGKGWDHGVPGAEFWTAAMRVAKPGAHLLAFGGTRTHHRLMCAIEDAGWEIRDCVMWVYGSGFPKSLDVSKAIDKIAPRAGQFEAFAAHFAECQRRSGMATTEFVTHFPHYKNADSIKAQVSNWRLGKNVPTLGDFRILRTLIGLSDDWDALIERVEAEREIIASIDASRLAVAPGQDNDRSATVVDITAPATDAARQWSGWGTSLKPAWEPIILARKPLAGTVAANVLKHGTGGLNIDGSRIGTGGESLARPFGSGGIGAAQLNAIPRGTVTGADQTGRWPANLILSYPEDEYELRSDLTAAQRKQATGWLYENA